MSYIFSSNPNNYTFRKLDNIFINMPENDGKHALIRETVDGVPQYSWITHSGCFVKVNNVTLFEHTPISTQPFNNQCQFQLSSGLYLIITSIPCYNENNTLFKHCDSIESIVDKGYKVSVSMDGVSLLDVPFIDTLNNLVTLSHTKLVNGIEWTSESHTISTFTNIPSLVCLGGVKSITIVFRHLGEVVVSSSSSSSFGCS